VNDKQDRSMRYLITQIFPPCVGGSGRWFHEAFRRYAPDSNLIITRTMDTDSHSSFTGCRVQRIRWTLRNSGFFSWSGFVDYFKLAIKIRSIIKGGDRRIVLAGRMVPEGWIALMVAGLKNVKIVCFAHGEEINLLDSQNGNGVMSSLQHRMMGRLVVLATHHWIVNSYNTREILTRDWGVTESSISVIHPGVDTAYFRPALFDAQHRRDYNWSDRLVILTVGRLQKRKGHDHMIRAIKTLAATFPTILYVIAGDGEEYQNLAKLVEECGLQSHVQFHQTISDELLRKFYQQCDVFILPNRAIGSDIEGFGMVLLEAAACGKVVIAGASGGTAETMDVGKTGFIVDCNDPAVLANHLLKILSSPALVDFGTAGRSHVEANFSWDQVAKKLDDVLESL
jgi:phosphatidylinositol alpha-1,6-mannosyltransferase